MKLRTVRVPRGGLAYASWWGSGASGQGSSHTSRRLDKSMLLEVLQSICHGLGIACLYIKSRLTKPLGEPGSTHSTNANPYSHNSRHATNRMSAHRKANVEHVTLRVCFRGGRIMQTRRSASDTAEDPSWQTSSAFLQMTGPCKSRSPKRKPESA